MTTNHHSPHGYHADLTSAELNRPLGELDAAIETVITTGSGVSTTLTAQASAGQATLLVASSAGYVTGDPIYIGTGAMFESRIVNTVPGGGVTITVTVNLTNTYAIGKPVSKSPVEIVAARGGFTTLGARIKLLEDRAIDVRVYGADDSGVSDSLATIQAAIDENPLASIVFPGKFKITAPLTFAGEGQRFQGTGAAGFQYAGSVIKGDFAGPLLTDPNNGTRHAGLTIDGLTFINESGDAAARGIDLSHTTHAHVTNCVVRGKDAATMLAVGILLDGPAYFTRIRDASLSWCGAAIHCSTGTIGGLTEAPNASSFVNNSMDACDYGLYAEWGLGMSFIGNSVDGYNTCGVRLVGASRCFIAGNYLEWYSGSGEATPVDVWVSSASAVDNQIIGNGHAGNGAPILDEGLRTMQWDYTNPLTAGNRGIILREQAGSVAPIADEGLLFLEDNGAGKSVLKVRFHTGAVQTIATEP